MPTCLSANMHLWPKPTVSKLAYKRATKEAQEMHIRVSQEGQAKGMYLAQGWETAQAEM
jgi:hypothetical protein